MKTLFHSTLIIILFAFSNTVSAKESVFTNTSTFASTFTSLDGNWYNVNPNSVPKLYISANSTKIRIWGKCSPTNCDWGTVSLTKYGSGFRAIFNSHVAKRTLYFSVLADGRLRMRGIYDYKDSRPSKKVMHYFKQKGIKKIDGNWVNEDANTRSIPKLLVYASSSKIRAWGKCHPTNCEWGAVALAKSDSRYKAVFNDHVARRTMSIVPLPGNRLKVSLVSDYHDSRPTKRSVQYFKRATTKSIDGKWVNTNPKGGLAKLNIYANSSKIHAWAKCGGGFCDWGATKLYKAGTKYKAVFNDHAAKRYIIISPIGGGKIKLEATYDYHDSRPTKKFTHYFVKAKSL